MSKDSKTILFESIIPLAKFSRISKKTGKQTEQLCTINNYSRWKREVSDRTRNGKTTPGIRTLYKQLLRDFFIPEPEDETFYKITIDYTILRHNKRKIDTDGLIFNHKWLADLLQEMGWISDDDQVTLIIRPYIVDKNLNETQFKVIAYETI